VVFWLKEMAALAVIKQRLKVINPVYLIKNTVHTVWSGLYCVDHRL